MNRNHIVTPLALGILIGLIWGCSSVELSKIPQKPLPSSPPRLTELPLELPPEGGPRRPVDPSGPSALGANLPQITLTETDQSAFRTTAEQDQGVRNQLGERFGFINMEEVYPDQCGTSGEKEGVNPLHLTERPSTQDRVHRLTYYSYSHNVAVNVCLKGNQVTLVQPDPRKGYQPEESPEEVERAIATARKDVRIAQDVQNLYGHAILTSPEEYRYFWINDEAGFGDRVLWVTFSEAPESLALFFARVNLTTDKVLDAGKEPGPQ